MAGMASLIQDLPKAELHLHLEGSLSPEILHELDPETPLETIRAMYDFADFEGFLAAFAWAVQRLRRPEDYGLVARRLLEGLAAQNVRYAEIILSAGVALWKKQEFGPIFDAVTEAAQDSSVEVRWILDGVRHFGVEHVQAVAELAVERAGRGVVALGIGGSEPRGPAGWFAGVFADARSRGLHLTAHAGEACGPESVWAALEIGAERIGHGFRSIEDPVLVRHLADHSIPLDISITSNVLTRSVASLDEHPVRRLFDAGVPITLNTDDPAFFRTTLSAEYELARARFGFTATELEQIAQNAFRFAFRDNLGK